MKAKLFSLIMLFLVSVAVDAQPIRKNLLPPSVARPIISHSDIGENGILIHQGDPLAAANANVDIFVQKVFNFTDTKVAKNPYAKNSHIYVYTKCIDGYQLSVKAYETVGDIYTRFHGYWAVREGVDIAKDDITRSGTFEIIHNNKTATIILIISKYITPEQIRDSGAIFSEADFKDNAIKTAKKF